MFTEQYSVTYLLVIANTIHLKQNNKHIDDTVRVHDQEKFASTFELAKRKQIAVKHKQ